MNVEFKKIPDHILFFVSERRKNILAIAISLVVLSIFFLYREMFCGLKKRQLRPLTLKGVEHYTNKNREAIKESAYLTRILFRGSVEKQEVVARKMATDLGVPFHHFDGREFKKNYRTFNDLLQRVSSGKSPEFIFVSHADEICRKGNSILDTILVYTGSVSQKLLLCLGVSSKINLLPDLASRYREQLIIDPTTIGV